MIAYVIAGLVGIILGLTFSVYALMRGYWPAVPAPGLADYAPCECCGEMLTLPRCRACGAPHPSRQYTDASP